MQQMIVLRDLPGIAEIERGWLVPGRHLLKEFDGFDDRLNEVSLSLFGITEEDTHYRWKEDDYDTASRTSDPDGMLPLHPEALGRRDRWEANFEFLYYEYEEENAFWNAVGIDVRGTDGEPLACLECFGRQIVCAVKQLLPSATINVDGQARRRTSSVEEWGARLQAEAAKFKSPRRR